MGATHSLVRGLVFNPPDAPSYADDAGVLAFIRGRSAFTERPSLATVPLIWLTTARGWRIPAIHWRVTAGDGGETTYSPPEEPLRGGGQRADEQGREVRGRGRTLPTPTTTCGRPHRDGATTSPSRHTLLYAHDNASDLGLVAAYLAELHEVLDVDVFAFEYSGYGLSTPLGGGRDDDGAAVAAAAAAEGGARGRPPGNPPPGGGGGAGNDGAGGNGGGGWDGRPTASEANCYADAAAAWEHLTITLGLPPSSVTVVGRSLGAAVAVHLATSIAAAATAASPTTATSTGAPRDTAGTMSEATAGQMAVGEGLVARATGPPAGLLLISPFASVGRLAPGGRALSPLLGRGGLDAFDSATRLGTVASQWAATEAAAIATEAAARVGVKGVVSEAGRVASSPRIPVLLVHGGADRLVPPAHSYLLARRLGAAAPDRGGGDDDVHPTAAVAGTAGGDGCGGGDGGGGGGGGGGGDSGARARRRGGGGGGRRRPLPPPPVEVVIIPGGDHNALEVDWRVSCFAAYRRWLGARGVGAAALTSMPAAAAATGPTTAALPADTPAALAAAGIDAGGVGGSHQRRKPALEPPVRELSGSTDPPPRGNLLRRARSVVLAAPSQSLPGGTVPPTAATAVATNSTSVLTGVSGGGGGNGLGRRLSLGIGRRGGRTRDLSAPALWESGGREGVGGGSAAPSASTASSASSASTTTTATKRDAESGRQTEGVGGGSTDGQSAVADWLANALAEDRRRLARLTSIHGSGGGSPSGSGSVAAINLPAGPDAGTDGGSSSSIYVSRTRGSSSRNGVSRVGSSGGGRGGGGLPWHPSAGWSGGTHWGGRSGGDRGESMVPPPPPSPQRMQALPPHPSLSSSTLSSADSSSGSCRGAKRVASRQGRQRLPAVNTAAALPPPDPTNDGSAVAAMRAAGSAVRGASRSAAMAATATAAAVASAISALETAATDAAAARVAAVAVGGAGDGGVGATPVRGGCRGGGNGGGRGTPSWASTGGYAALSVGLVDVKVSRPPPVTAEAARAAVAGVAATGAVGVPAAVTMGVAGGGPGLPTPQPLVGRRASPSGRAAVGTTTPAVACAAPHAAAGEASTATMATPSTTIPSTAPATSATSTASSVTSATTTASANTTAAGAATPNVLAIGTRTTTGAVSTSVSVGTHETTAAVPVSDGSPPATPPVRLTGLAAAVAGRDGAAAYAPTDTPSQRLSKLRTRRTRLSLTARIEQHVAKLTEASRATPYDQLFG